MRESTSPKLKDRLLRKWSELMAGNLAAVEGNLVAAADADHPRTIMVVSARPGEGRTSSAGCLGLALSNAGRTLLIDGHTHKPDLSEGLATREAAGLSEVLLDGADINAVVQPTDTEMLAVLPAGQRADSGAAMLRSPAFPKLLSRLRERWDFIICDTPPFLTSSEAPLMARHFDGALLVVSCEDTRWEVARVVMERLEAAQGRVIAAILNRRRYYIPGPFYRNL